MSILNNKEAILDIIGKIDLTQYEDAKYFEYFIWEISTDMIELLRTKRWYPDIKDFARSLLTQPKSNIASYNELAYMGEFDTTFNIQVYHYGILRFILQFTNDIEMYNEGINIIKTLSHVKGNVMDPSVVLYLVSLNPINGPTNNFIVPKPFPYINIVDKIYHSVLFPSPSREIEYQRLLKDLEQYDLKINRIECPDIISILKMLPEKDRADDINLIIVDACYNKKETNFRRILDEKIFDSMSGYAQYAIRISVENNVYWMLKALVECGVSVDNLRTFGYKWSLNGMQLYDILKQDIINEKRENIYSKNLNEDQRNHIIKQYHERLKIIKCLAEKSEKNFDSIVDEINQKIEKYGLSQK